MKDDKLEEKKSLNRRGLKIGSIATGTGAALIGISKYSGKEFKKLSKEEMEKAIRGGVDKSIKSTSRIGKGLVAIGAPLLGYSIYKHYKYKNKKDDNKA